MHSKYKFLLRHKKEFQSTFEVFKAKEWSLAFPVFIFERSWFKLKKIRLDELAHQLQPDNSQEAPELSRYEQMIGEDYDPIAAVQECWHEFGMEDFHRALRTSWDWKIKGNHGWTFKKYAKLISEYRKSSCNSEISFPIIILGRSPSDEHTVEWITEKSLVNMMVN